MSEKTEATVDLTKNEAQQEEQTQEAAPVIDMKKYDDNKAPQQELSELEQIKQKYADMQAELEKERTAKKRIKDRYDQVASEISARNKEEQKAQAEIEKENEAFIKVTQELEQLKLEKKKQAAMYSFRDSWGVQTELAEKLVGGLFFEDTNEVSVPVIVESFGDIVDSVRTQAYEDGYNTAIKEAASGKPRSIGGEQVAITPEEEALNRYLSKRVKK